MSIQVKKVTISTAEILNLVAAPKQLLPAPATGYANVILSITEKMIFNTVGYDGTGLLYAYTEALSITTIFNDNQRFRSTVNVCVPFIKSNSSYPPAVIIDALLLSVTNLPTVGDSPIDVYVVYEEKLIS